MKKDDITTWPVFYIIWWLAAFPAGYILGTTLQEPPQAYCVTQATANEYHMPSVKVGSTTAIWATTKNGVRVLGLCEDALPVNNIKN